MKLILMCYSKAHLLDVFLNTGLSYDNMASKSGSFDFFERRLRKLSCIALKILQRKLDISGILS